MHEIDESTGKPAVFTVDAKGIPPWHRLGNVLTSSINSDEAIVEAKQNWLVGNWKLQAVNENGVVIDIPSKIANVRSDTNGVLGIVSKKYKVFQNHEAFSLVNEIVKDKLAIWDSAGCLKNGEYVWMQAKLPKTLYATPEDAVETYVLVTNCHNGTRGLYLLPTSVRVVCWNTLSLAIGSGKRKKKIMKIRHYGSLKNKVEEIRSHLGIVNNRLDMHQEEIDALKNKKLKKKESNAYFDSIFPTQSLLDAVVRQTQERMDIVEELLDVEAERIFHEVKRNKEILDIVLANYDNAQNNLNGIERSAWSAYNSVSQWTDHQQPLRKNTDVLSSIWFGQANEIKQEAWENALALTR